MAYTNGSNGVKLEADELFESEDEYEEDEQEFTPSQTGAGGKTLISEALKPYHPSQLTTEILYQRMHAGSIDVDPDYQRDVVWNEARQTALIDSIFQNYYIPPVLFASKKHPDTGRAIQTCIDGKQRLTSIRLFMDGVIPWKPKTGPGVGKRWWYRLPQTKSARDFLLPENDRVEFADKTLQLAVFNDLPPAAERDIFQRVQLGVALAPAEKLSALETPMARYVHTVLQKHIWSPGSFNHYVKDWDQTRGRPFQNMATLIYYIYSFPEEKLSVSATAVSQFLQRADPPTDKLRYKIDKIWGNFNDIVKNHQEAALHTVPNRLAPVEFIFLGVAIHMLRPYYDNAQVAEYMGRLRKEIRAKESNMRANSTVTRMIWDFLNAIPKTRRRALEDSDDSDIELDGDDAEYEPRASTRKRGRA